MKYIFFIFLLVLSANSVHAQALSEQAEVSLITIAPGKELYSSFGHNAIRIHDPVFPLDRAYNYGVFDFHTPNFYLKFTRGQLDYEMAINDYPAFERFYRTMNRSMTEQVLNLTQTEKQTLFRYLETNALPANKYYRYDFFFKNCATQIRDAFLAIMGDSIVFVPSSTNTQLTFRQLLEPYLKRKPWSDLGINLGLGAIVDRVTVPYEQMFLPDYLAAGFQNGYRMKNGKQEPIVNQQKVIFEASSVRSSPLLFTQPIFIFWGVATIILFLTWVQIRGGKYDASLDIAIFFVTGLLGVLLTLLWFATDHRATVNNFNILWLNPLHIVAALLLFLKPTNKWLGQYFLLTAVSNLFLLIPLPIWPQHLYPAFVPLVVLLVCRGSFLYWKGRKKFPQ